MDDSRLDRRTFLTAAGAGLLGAVAGCAEPGSTVIAGETTGSIDDRPQASGSMYTDVYEETIDSVAQVRALGVPSPFDDSEGQGQGSAFLFADEYVVTNEHVVAEANDVDLQYIDGDWADADVVGMDVFSDLAVLEVDTTPETATPLPISEERPVTGQEVLAIGNPFGLDGSMSQGIVSGVDRSLRLPGRNFSVPNVIQTDAAVNPGNSGGPLVDLDGDVIGVVNAGGGDNIGFAISAALVERVVPTLIEEGEYHHSYMGITLRSVDPTVAEENDLPEATGIIVNDIQPDGPAADSSLQGSDEMVERHGEPIPVGGDVIYQIDGDPIPDQHALSSHLALETTPGDTITLSVWRDSSETTVDLTLGIRPEPE